MELGGDALGLQSLQPPLHGTPACDAVIGPHAGIGGRVALCVLTVTRVLHDDRSGPGQIPAAEACRTIAAQICRHPRSGGAAPERVAGGIHFQLVRVFKNKCDSPRQILTGGLRARAVNQCKSVVAHFGQFQRMGETVVHGPDIGETAASVAYGKAFAGSTLEEKQSRVFLGGVSRFFLICINVIEDRIACFGVEVHIIYDFHGLVRVDIVVPSQPQVPQGISTVVASIYREDQPAIAAKDGIVYHIGYGGIGSIRSIYALRGKAACQWFRACGSGYLRSSAAGT